MPLGWRSAILLLLLAVQCGVMMFARFDDRRYFCWAPHDQRTVYSIAAEINGRPLDEEEIFQRYRIAPTGYEFRATVHTLALVGQVEQQHTPDEQAQVTVTYRVNGGPEEVWQWPAR